MPLPDTNLTTYRFSFGPWNISEGADPFGPDARPVFPHERKFALYKPLGFDAVQFHDDDVVPKLDELAPRAIAKQTAAVSRMLSNQGLAAEFVAPRLWFAKQTIDGGYTSNNESDRQYAWERTQRAIDIAKILNSRAIVLWLAREGSYIREAKCAKLAYERILAVLNRILDYDKEIEIWIEPKPNEPTDQAYVPTAGHAISLAYASNDQRRVKTVVETAHAVLANLDPSDEMAFALAHDKLGSVHLNDQNGLKFDQDKNFGSANIRAAFNQVMVLERHGYGQKGEYIGLDVKAMRTQHDAPVVEHLRTSRRMFLHLLGKVRSFDQKRAQTLRHCRDYEGLERYTLEHIVGIESESPAPTRRNTHINHHRRSPSPAAKLRTPVPK